METGSPRKIQFTVPLLDTHLDPEAAEQIRRRRPTPATLVASSDQSSPEIDEDRLPNQLYKAALLNSPRQRRKGQKGTPTMKELQFMVEHHLYKQQQQGGAAGGDEISSESCLSDRPSPDSAPGALGDELPHDDDDDEDGDDEEDTAEAFEKLRCQMEEFSRESLLEGGLECPLSKEEVGCSNLPVVAESSSQPNSTRADTTAAVATASSASSQTTQGGAIWSAADGKTTDKSSGRHNNAAQTEPAADGKTTDKSSGRHNNAAQTEPAAKCSD